MNILYLKIQNSKIPVTKKGSGMWSTGNLLMDMLSQVTPIFFTCNKVQCFGMNNKHHSA